MVRVDPVVVGDHVFTGVTVELPKTRLIVLATPKGYIMCGALDIGLLNDRLAERGIVAARCVGVRTYEDLLNCGVESATKAAEELGIKPGMPGREALLRML
ncbi:MAG TPA: DUF1805 domain-containing protein [Sphingobacteriaceae bacterium]|nr:DUF1805 domain-containing protein [Sphingobacteriaceae bacterium]